MVYICTKFHENILNGIRVMERTRNVNGRTDGRPDRQTDGRTDRVARHNTTCLRRAYKKESFVKPTLKCMKTPVLTAIGNVLEKMAYRQYNPLSNSFKIELVDCLSISPL